MQFLFGILLQISFQKLVQDQKLSSALVLKRFRCLVLQDSFENSNRCAVLTPHEVRLGVSETSELMCRPLSVQQEKVSLALMVSKTC